MKKIHLDIDDLKIFVALAFFFIIALVTIPYWLPIKIYHDLNDKEEEKVSSSWATQPNIFGEI